MSLLFNQYDDKDVEWLLRSLARDGYCGFYEDQDVADLMQGRSKLELSRVVKDYVRRRKSMKMQDLLAWLRKERVARGCRVDEAWQDAEDRVRLRQVTSDIPPPTDEDFCGNFT